MVQGKILLFVSSLLSGFCVSDIELVCAVSTFSSMMRFSPAVFLSHRLSANFVQYLMHY